MQDLYKQAVAIYRKPLELTPEQATTLETARSAYTDARNQAEQASKARKNREERIEATEALVTVTRAAYAAAQEPEKRADATRYKSALAVAEKLWERIAWVAFGTISDSPLRYVNVVPTGTTKEDYYGTHDVYRTTVDDGPFALRVKAFEVADQPYRITWQGNTLDSLSFKVVVLSDKDIDGAPGVRDERWGGNIEIAHETGRFHTKPGVTIRWNGPSGMTVEDAKVYLGGIALGMEVARLVEEAIA